MGRLVPPAERPARTTRDAEASGFTLVELVAATALAGLVLGAMMALAGTASDASERIEKNLRGLQSAVDAVSAVRDDLPRARLEAIAPDGASLTYSLPVPAGPGGAFIDERGRILWGANGPGGFVVGDTLTLEFVFERVLDETADAVDYNRDGDRLDAFDLGTLRRRTNAGARRAFPPVEVVLVRGAHGADVDADGVPDPLFAVTPGRNEVVTRLAYLTADRAIKVREARCSFTEANL